MFTGMKIDDPNTPWHLSHSDWSDKYMAERVERVANMLREKAKHVALNHIVVLVGHGDMNKRVLFNLLGIDANKVSTNLQNTSCSLLTLNPKENMTNLNFFNGGIRLIIRRNRKQEKNRYKKVRWLPRNTHDET